MIERGKHTAGFTLAELMMSIAIILILAAIAIPSIVTAQNNMRMVELNNAAQSIANAAQTQMTAKKVSGTWMGFLDERADDVKGKDYLLRDEARSSGIVTSLSIDSTVYEGDYVIEFDRATASVTRVFYADGKSGFFGEAPASTNSAQIYYADGHGTPDQAARKANDPMIGYYEGTPAGATPEVALYNPVIWVDEKTGCLMVQDPNISEDGSTGSTNATVRIENTTQGVSFVLSGLSKDPSTLSVSDDEGTDALGLSGSEASDVVVLVGRDGVAPGNVYSIDLNKLSDKATAKGSDTLKGIFAKCQRNDDLKVQVELQDSQKPCVPARAAANIKWPEPVGKLTLMVTNPYSEAVKADEAADGNASDDGEGESPASPYKEPAVLVTDDKGAPAVGKDVTQLSEDTDHYLRRTNANAKLKAENAQAAYQSYKGASVPSSSVRNDSTFRFQATVGSYNQHEYQIWELWLKRADNGEMMRVGYLNGDAWEWAKFTQAGVQYDYAPLDKCFTWYDKNGTSYSSIAGMDTDELEIVTVAFNASVFYDTASEYPGLQIADEDDNAMLYVRTAPKASEVQAYFSSLSKSNTQGQGSGLVASFLSARTDQTSSRGTNPSSSPARAAFESEFGASSSDVSWVVTSQREAGFEHGNSYLESSASVRVYYSIAPAVGFKNIREYGGGQNDQYLSGVRSTRMTNVALWLFRGDSLEALEAMPEALLKNENDFEYTCRSGSNYDFKLTTLEDFRFYRVLSYYDEDGKTKLDYPDQYVPHSEAAEAVVAGKDNPPTKPETEEYTYQFTGWTTTDVRDPETGSVTCQPGETIEQHDDELALQGTKFVASFKDVKKPKVSLGLAYLELDAAGAVTGWYGYMGTEENTFDQNLPANNAIEDWGYFILAAEGTERDAIAQGSGNAYKIADQPIAVNLNGTNLAAYRILAPSDAALKNKATSIEVYVNKSTSTQLHAVYQVNFNFARAVALGDKEAGSWGTSESPWVVRHAAQFPGSLKWISNSSVQLEYMDSYFVQDHDIDMLQAQPYISSLHQRFSPLVGNLYNYMSKFNAVFKGSYSGGSDRGSFIVQNVSASMESGGSGFVSSDGSRGKGLFPSISDATLSNVSIVVRGEEEVVKTNGTIKFGILAGYVETSNVVSCSVKGEPADGVAANLIVVDIDGTSKYFGGLVGQAVGSNLYDSGIGSLSVTFKRIPGQKWDGPFFGGMVGYASGSGLYGCSVSNVEFCLTDANLKNVFFGGFVGSGSQATVSWGNSANDSQAKDVSVSFAEGSDADMLRCGAVYGNNEYASQCSFYKREESVSGVTYAVGAGESVDFSTRDFGWPQ